MRYVVLILKGALTLIFVAAGSAKLIGADMMVGTFDQVGLGQWFRYVTGLIEIGSALLLWVPGLQIIGAALLTCTMIGAVLAHALVLGPSSVPAIVLGILSAGLLYHYRGQLATLARR